MSKLELSYPAKPYTITQAFGIYNPAYEQFGFNRHNGIDFRVDIDGLVVAMCRGKVYEVGFNEGAGYFVRYRTLEPTTIDGNSGYVAFMYMHGLKQLVKVGDVVASGTPLMIADNTGFSTGPHTHISAYLVDYNNKKLSFGNKDSDYCFDFSKYYNGYYADDVKTWWDKLMEIKKKLIGLLST